MSDGFFDTYRGVVQPDQCDAFGHMNTQYYVAIFDHTLLALVRQLGWAGNPTARSGFGWADVRHEIDYRAELLVGAELVGRSAVLKLGGSSLTSLHYLFASGTDKPAAALKAVSVYFDLSQRSAAQIPEVIRAQAEAAVIAAPD